MEVPITVPEIHNIWASSSPKLWNHTKNKNISISRNLPRLQDCQLHLVVINQQPPKSQQSIHVRLEPVKDRKFEVLIDINTKEL